LLVRRVRNASRNPEALAAWHRWQRTGREAVHSLGGRNRFELLQSE
jgi:hypothetical protein